MTSREIQIIESRLRRAYAILRRVDFDKVVIRYAWRVNKEAVCLHREGGGNVGSETVYMALDFPIGKTVNHFVVERFTKLHLIDQQNNYIYKRLKDNYIFDLLYSDTFSFGVDPYMVQTCVKDVRSMTCELTALVLQYSDDGYTLLGAETVSEYYDTPNAIKGLHNPHTNTHYKQIVSAAREYIVSLYPEYEKTVFHILENKKDLMELKRNGDGFSLEITYSQLFNFLSHKNKIRIDQIVDKDRFTNNAFSFLADENVYLSVGL